MDFTWWLSTFVVGEGITQEIQTRISSRTLDAVEFASNLALFHIVSGLNLKNIPFLFHDLNDSLLILLLPNLGQTECDSFTALII